MRENSGATAFLRPRCQPLCSRAGCVLIATMIRLALGYVAFESSAFGPYYAATLIISLLCGWRAASAGATVGGFCAFVLFVLPDIGPLGTKATAVVSLCLYGASSIVIISAAESYRKLLVHVRAQEQYTKLLSNEMAHRIKNILTVAQTIVWHSLPEDPLVRDKVSSRLAALARTNERVLRTRGGPMLFSTLLSSELEHFGTTRADEIRSPIFPAARAQACFCRWSSMNSQQMPQSTAR